MTRARAENCKEGNTRTSPAASHVLSPCLTHGTCIPGMLGTGAMETTACFGDIPVSILGFFKPCL